MSYDMRVIAFYLTESLHIGLLLAVCIKSIPVRQINVDYHSFMLL